MLSMRSFNVRPSDGSKQWTFAADTELSSVSFPIFSVQNPLVKLAVFVVLASDKVVDSGTGRAKTGPGHRYRPCQWTDLLI